MEDSSSTVNKVLVRLIEVQLPLDGTDLLKRKNWGTDEATNSKVLMAGLNWISWNAV